MKKTIGKPNWAENIEKALDLLSGNEEECKRILNPDYRQYAKASYDLARRKYESEMKVYGKALDEGYIIVDTEVNLPFKESAGLLLSRFFSTLRDDAKILALTCPECKRVIFPPRAVCGFCRIMIGEKAEDWLMLDDTGTVTSILLSTEREVDRATARIVGEPNPCAFIRLDGGDEWTVLVHYLEMVDLKKLRVGMRVKAVWKGKEERKGRMSDIKYFQIIKD